MYHGQGTLYWKDGEISKRYKGEFINGIRNGQGIYYENDSLKRKLCMEGKKELYTYCEKKNIPHKKIGKIIIGTKAEKHMRCHIFVVGQLQRSSVAPKGRVAS